MAVIETGDGTGNLQTIESNKSGRAVVLPRGAGYSVSAITGTMAAALAANSSIFVMRMNPSSTVLAFITRINIDWVTIAAFTTPVTAGRRLSLVRGSGAAASSGTATATMFKKDSSAAASQFNASVGGDARIATTGALTVTGITFETEERMANMLSSSGAAGNKNTDIMTGDASQAHPIILRPGELLALRNPVAMDAGGTWQVGILVDWYEK